MKTRSSLHRKLLIALALSTLLPIHSASTADQEQSKPEAETDSQLSLSFRYRYEYVDQDGFAKDARASTLRTRLTYQSPYSSDFGLLLEIDDVRSIGNDLYNSTRNGNTSRPTVADPVGTELNQALIAYRGFESTVIRAGRQRIKLDNQRFVGDVGWRQHDQTYDSLSITNASLKNTAIEYAYIDTVNRVFGPDGGTPPAEFQSDSHILNAKHEWSANWDTAAYAYFFDLEDAPLLSNKTYGLRITGHGAINDKVSTHFTFEYAQQTDFGDNPNNYKADYSLIEGALSTAGVTGKLGYEVLEGNPIQPFQTPLATLHAFQGWADKFLTTPAGGIEDFYFSIGKRVRATSLLLVYHRFNPESGGPSYGSEWDLMISHPFAKRYSLVFKYANYDAHSFATDTEKAWIMMTARFGD